MLIDTHCHFDTFHQEGTIDAVLSKAEEAGVKRMIAIGTSSEDWTFNKTLRDQYPERMAYTVGLHPCHVGEDWEDQFVQLATFFSEEQGPVGIGEIGLDYHRLSPYPDEAALTKSWQLEALRTQLSLVLQFDCPVVIHSRNAFEDCVQTIDDSGIDWQKVVFHCFSEGPDAVRQLNERGARASFTGILTYKNAPEVRAAALAQGIDSLMIETDAPYLAPVPQRGKPNEPAFLKHIAEYAAELFGMDYASFAEKTTANAKAFWGL